MSYTTPHKVRDFAFAACLRVNHLYHLRCQRRSETDKRGILMGTREIDLCAMVADYCGSSAHLSAQGTSDEDVHNDAPVFALEIKYIVDHKVGWEQVKKDWEWLLRPSNVNGNFEKRAFIIFWPSTTMYKLTGNISVPKGHGTQYSQLDFAPFVPYAEPENPKNGANQRLRFRSALQNRVSAMQLPGGKRIRCEVVGEMSHPIWAAIYSRMTPDEYLAMPPGQVTDVTDDPINIL